MSRVNSFFNVSRLAAAAAPKKVTPTAGSYAIERFVLPDDIEIPPESMTNEGEFFPFNLDEDKMPPFILDRRDVLKHIPKELLESEVYKNLCIIFSNFFPNTTISSSSGGQTLRVYSSPERRQSEA